MEKHSNYYISRQAHFDNCFLVDGVVVVGLPFWLFQNSNTNNKNDPTLTPAAVIWWSWRANVVCGCWNGIHCSPNGQKFNVVLLQFNYYVIPFYCSILHQAIVLLLLQLSLFFFLLSQLFHFSKHFKHSLSLIRVTAIKKRLRLNCSRIWKFSNLLQFQNGWCKIEND